MWHRWMMRFRDRQLSRQHLSYHSTGYLVLVSVSFDGCETNWLSCELTSPVRMLRILLYLVWGTGPWRKRVSGPPSARRRRGCGASWASRCCWVRPKRTSPGRFRCRPSRKGVSSRRNCCWSCTGASRERSTRRSGAGCGLRPRPGTPRRRAGRRLSCFRLPVRSRMKGRWFGDVCLLLVVHFWVSAICLCYEDHSTKSAYEWMARVLLYSAYAMAWVWKVIH